MIRHRFDLDRLSPIAVGKLAAARGLIGSAIHQATGGNPLLVTELLAADGKRSISIDDIVLGRADLLGEAARAFLDYCSIIPRRVSLEQIDAAGVTDAVIAACSETGLLLADGTGLAFRRGHTPRGRGCVVAAAPRAEASPRTRAAGPRLRQRGSPVAPCDRRW